MSFNVCCKCRKSNTTENLAKVDLGFCYRCIAFQRHCGDPRSILDDTIWSLTSLCEKRISCSKNFRSPPQKDFCNNIDQ